MYMTPGSTLVGRCLETYVKSTHFGSNAIKVIYTAKNISHDLAETVGIRWTLSKLGGSI